MAERVVDLLEVVEIKEQHSELPAIAELGDRGLQVFLEQPAVRQVGQRVVTRHECNLRRGLALLAHIVERDHDTAVGHRLGRDVNEQARAHLHLDLHRAPRGQQPGDLVADVARFLPGMIPMSDGDVDHLAHCQAVPDTALGRAEDLEVAPVHELHEIVRAPHDEALLHAVQRRVEQEVGAPQCELAQTAGDGVGAEHLDRPRHRANLVSPLAPRHGEIGIASGEPVHQRRQSEHRPGDAASHHDRTEQDQHRSANAKTEQQMLRIETAADRFLRECQATLREQLHQFIEAGAQKAELVVGDAGVQCAVARVIGCELDRLAHTIGIGSETRAQVVRGGWRDSSGPIEEAAEVLRLCVKPRDQLLACGRAGRPDRIRWCPVRAGRTGVRAAA